MGRDGMGLGWDGVGLKWDGLAMAAAAALLCLANKDVRMQQLIECAPPSGASYGAAPFLPGCCYR